MFSFIFSAPSKLLEVKRHECEELRVQVEYVYSLIAINSPLHLKLFNRPLMKACQSVLWALMHMYVSVHTFLPALPPPVFSSLWDESSVLAANRFSETHLSSTCRGQQRSPTASRRMKTKTMDCIIVISANLAQCIIQAVFLFVYSVRSNGCHPWKLRPSRRTWHLPMLTRC